MATPDPHEPIPEDNRPGHHPEHEQDKPDLDKFAARFGIKPAEDDPAGDTDAAAATVEADEVDGAVAPAIPITKGRQPRLPADPVGGADPHVPVDHLAPLPDLRSTPGRQPHVVAGPTVPEAPVSPIDPAALVGEVFELGFKFAVSAALLPARLTAASVRAVVGAVTGDNRR